MSFRVSAAFLLALAGAITISCGGIVDPSQNTVDTFTGTVPAGGTGPAHHFSASKTGEIQVKIVTLTPASVPGVIVNWAGNGDGSCNGGIFQQGVGASATTAISGQVVSGSYCIVVQYYAGPIVATNYTLTVSHP
jgi:hypothetical protein